MNLRNYIYSHCISPTKVKVFDSYSGTFVYRDVPCGKCLHCRNTRVSEWVTRLYAEQAESNYTYYITLDYAPFPFLGSPLFSDTSLKISRETYACKHDINKTHHFALHPLLLNKQHLSYFFKRLRKNTGVSLRYFACGEYGHLYGRPHYHAIIFSDSPISKEDCQRAWTLNDYKIGNVDFNDLVANGTTLENTGYTSKYVFSYVCKYLQKGFCDFNKLPTIKYIREAFKDYYCQTHQILFFNENENYSDLEDCFKLFCQENSPFTCCSRRPAIGFSYLQKNLQRFKKADFRLFGLSKKCTIFPYYFLRKTKEFACPIVPLGSVSQSPSSPSRLPNLVSILRAVYDSDVDISHWIDTTSPVWNRSKGKLIYKEYDKKTYKKDLNDIIRELLDEKTHSINYSDLHVYDLNHHQLYTFDGYGYKIWNKIRKLGYCCVGYIHLIDAIHLFGKYSDDFYNSLVIPLHSRSVINQSEFDFEVCQMFPDSDSPYDEFKKLSSHVYDTELSHWRAHGLIIQNTKTLY